MSAVSKGLGKGLGALLSVEGIPEQQMDSVVELKINDISPYEDQPRKRFDEDPLQELAMSIKENGIIQPIIVTKKGQGYRIVAGERRWRAARIAGLTVIPAIIRDLTDSESMEQALIENIQRQDLNPLEEAYAMQHLMKVHKITQEDLAKKLGKSRPAIANTVRLTALDETTQGYVRSGMLSAGHARALMALEKDDDRTKAANAVVAREMSVRETEDYVKRLINLQQGKKADNKGVIEPMDAVTVSTKEVEKDLRKALGTRVRLKIKDPAQGKGSLVISYYSYDDLERLMEKMGVHKEK